MLAFKNELLMELVRVALLGGPLLARLVMLTLDSPSNCVRDALRVRVTCDLGPAAWPMRWPAMPVCRRRCDAPHLCSGVRACVRARLPACLRACVMTRTQPDRRATFSRLLLLRQHLGAPPYLA